MVDITKNNILRELAFIHAWMDDYSADDIGLYKYLTVIENKIRNFDYECALIFDVEGHHLSTILGDSYSIEFAEREKRMMTNCIVTHNHPIDTTFSLLDLNFFIDRSLYEIRAVSRKHIFSLRSGIERKFTFMDKKSYAHFNQYRRKWTPVPIGNTCECEADDRHQRMFIQYLVDKYGLIYTEEINPL